uniref:Protein kinase domain-containing protein n=1 Tax=Meloidogyne floridensis TaxID=298350 RepID=A0A915NK04_9BILA
MYIAMELGGESLENYHHTHQNVDIYNILKGAARALEQFHRHAIHLDIKQSNFVVSLDQNNGNEIACKLIDFGTSVLLPNAGGARLNILAQMHKAPEIRNDRDDRQNNITPKVDVWAFGIMSCQQLHGRVGRVIRQQFLDDTCRNQDNNSNLDRIIKASICKPGILLDILNKHPIF